MALEGDTFEDTVVHLSGIALPRVAKTAAYTATRDDFLIECDATSAAFTVTLPAIADAKIAGGASGIVYCIKKVDSSANAVTVDGSGSENVDGATTASLAAQWDSCLIMAGSDRWLILALSV
jgi:hypothetical protein